MWTFFNIYIFTWQRLPILPWSAAVGACDQVNIVQSNTVLCMVLLQNKNNNKEIKLLNVKMCP